MKTFKVKTWTSILETFEIEAGSEHEATVKGYKRDGKILVTKFCDTEVESVVEY